MTFPKKGKIFRWAMIAIATYVVLALFDVVPPVKVSATAILTTLIVLAAVLISLIVLLAVFSAIIGSGRADRISERGGRDYDLKLAVEREEYDIVKQLIAQGAHPDGYPEDDNEDEDDSALIVAVRSGSREIVAALIAAGANVNRATGGAAERGDPGVVWACPLAEAVSLGHRDIVKLLLEHGADHQALPRLFIPDADESVGLLIEIGENARAQDVARAANGVDFPVPNATLLGRARELDSPFVAYAERFKALGDYKQARRVCGWKIKLWKAGWKAAYRQNESKFPMQISVCLRTLAEINETEGNPEEALLLCRHAFDKWQSRGAPSAPLAVRDEMAPHAWLSRTLQPLMASGGAERVEILELLRNYERILGLLGRVGEQGDVAAALKRLEEV